MPLLDDLIPAEHLDRLIDVLLSYEDQINLLVDRKVFTYEAMRVALRDGGATKPQVKAAMADLKARIDTRRKQPRAIQAGSFPAGTLDAAHSAIASRVCATRDGASTMGAC